MTFFIVDNGQTCSLLDGNDSDTRKIRTFFERHRFFGRKRTGNRGLCGNIQSCFSYYYFTGYHIGTTTLRFVDSIGNARFGIGFILMGFEIFQQQFRFGIFIAVDETFVRFYNSGRVNATRWQHKLTTVLIGQIIGRFVFESDQTIFAQRFEIVSDWDFRMVTAAFLVK